jgi:hypothetical protein
MIRPNFDLPKDFIDARARAASEAGQLSPSKMVELPFGKMDGPSTPKKTDVVNEEERNKASTVKDASPTPSRARRAFFTFHPLDTPLNVADDVANTPTLSGSMQGMSIRKTASSLGLNRTASSANTVLTPSTPSWKKKNGKKLQKKPEVGKKDGTAYSMEELTEEKKAEIRATVKAAFDKFRKERMDPEVREPPKPHRAEDCMLFEESKPKAPAAVEATHDELFTQTAPSHVDVTKSQALLVPEENEPSVEHVLNRDATVCTMLDEHPTEQISDSHLNVQTLAKTFERGENRRTPEEAECASTNEEISEPRKDSATTMDTEKGMQFRGAYSSASIIAASSTN